MIHLTWQEISLQTVRQTSLQSSILCTINSVPKKFASCGYKASWFFNLASCEVVWASVVGSTGNALIKVETK